MKLADDYALSPMQQGLLFHSLSARQPGVDIEQILCALPEALDVECFARAWQRVVDRHPILRTSFRWEGLPEPRQEVHLHVCLPLEQIEWRGLPAAERAKRLEDYLREDRQRGFDLTLSPPMRFALFHTDDAEYQLLWTFHHLLLDGRSLVLLLNEVFGFYEAFCQGHDLQLDSPRPYRDYIDWLEQQDFSKGEAFWRQT